MGFFKYAKLKIYSPTIDYPAQENRDVWSFAYVLSMVVSKRKTNTRTLKALLHTTAASFTNLMICRTADGGCSYT